MPAAAPFLIVGATLASTAITAVQTYSQYKAQKAEGDASEKMYQFQSQIDESNARLSEMQAKDSIKRGEREEEDHRKRVRGLIGSQRASFAAQGIELSDGSALDIVEDTASLGAEDALTIRNNAWREAWGYRTQAANLQSSAAFSRVAGANAKASSKAAAKNTLITGGLQVAKGLINTGYGAYKTF